MKRTSFFRGLRLLAVVGFGVVSWAGQAAPVPFSVDPARSSVTCSGTVTVLGTAYPITQQGAGSLTTSYTGTLQVDLSGGTTRFDATSVITAQNSGNWSPLAGGAVGTAAANYGGVATAGGLETVNAAVRNAVLNPSSAALIMTGPNFDASPISFSFATGAGGSLDYRATGVSAQNGVKPLTGLSSNGISPNASLITSGTTQTLTIPVDTVFFFSLLATNDVQLNLKGTLVATHSTTPAADLPPTLITLTGNNITLQWKSAVGDKNRIESTLDLSTWSVRQASLTSTGTTTTYNATKTGRFEYFRRVPLP